MFSEGLAQNGVHRSIFLEGLFSSSKVLWAEREFLGSVELGGCHLGGICEGAEKRNP